MANPETAAPPSTAAGSGREPPHRPKRWLPTWRVGILLLVYLALAIWLQANDPTGDGGHSNVLTMLLGFAAVTTLILWYLLASRQVWWVRLLPLLATATVVVVIGSFYRIEQVSGDILLTFVPRSRPVTEPLLDLPLPLDPPSVDLVTTTPEDFPQFLGKNRNLAVDAVQLSRDWMAQPPELVWRQPIGDGWSGFAVVNGYAVTMEQRGERELVTCYEAATGKLIWAHSAATRYLLGEAVSSLHVAAGDGPRGTTTVEGGMVYALGATGRLWALNGADGHVVWEKDLLAETGMTPEEELEKLPYGRSNSPLVVGDLVVVPAGGPADGRRISLVAYDKNTGELRWQGGDRQISCSSPSVATLGGVEQILTVNEDTISGHDISNGRVLWEHPWAGRTNADANVSQAVPVGPDRVFVSKGYGLGAALFRLLRGEDGHFVVEQLWHKPRVLRTKFTNVTIVNDHVYGLSEGILECVELSSGRRVWKRGRYGHGQILRIGELLLVLTEGGEMVLVEATPERPNEVLGRFQALEGKTWNNFALYGSLLLVRNTQEAACYRLPIETTRAIPQPTQL